MAIEPRHLNLTEAENKLARSSLAFLLWADMRRQLILLIAVVILFLPAGCGGSRDKDVNKGKERPIPLKK